MKRSILSLLILLLAIKLSAQEDFAITHGPYLQQVSQTEATMVWVTSNDALSWVELAPDDGTHFYAAERPKYYQSVLGRKNVGRLHKVTVSGLSPSTNYRYRICSQEVLEMKSYYVQYGKVKYTNVYRGLPYTFKTLPLSGDISFTVLNDIHENNELLAKLALVSESTDPDLVFFNGDMVNSMLSEEHLFTSFMDTAVKSLASGTPVFFARGNHEARGIFSKYFMDYFPTPTGEPYYGFAAGDTYFLVLDGGEDKPDNDVDYWRLGDFDKYRARQAEWLKNQISSEPFLNARHRIVIIHVPPMDGEGSWHGTLEVERLFMPILNQAGIDLMLCAHLHRHMYFPAEINRNNFPVIINSNKHLVSVRTSGQELNVDIIDEHGDVFASWKYVK